MINNELIQTVFEEKGYTKTEARNMSNNKGIEALINIINEEGVGFVFNELKSRYETIENKINEIDSFVEALDDKENFYFENIKSTKAKDALLLFNYVLEKCKKINVSEDKAAEMAVSLSNTFLSTSDNAKKIVRRKPEKRNSQE